MELCCTKYTKKEEMCIDNYYKLSISSVRSRQNSGISKTLLSKQQGMDGKGDDVNGNPTAGTH